MRSEALEGELAGCRGRLEGLGEGCGRCWHMLEEARVSSQLLHCGSTERYITFTVTPCVGLCCLAEQALDSTCTLGPCRPAGGGAAGEMGVWTCCNRSMRLRSHCRICVRLRPVTEGGALTFSLESCCLYTSVIMPASPYKTIFRQGMVQRDYRPLVTRAGLWVQVLHLMLENEKLRCAAIETQGGLRHRTRLREQSFGQGLAPHAAGPHR